MLRGIALCIVALVPACEDELADPFLPRLAEHTGVGEPGPDTSNKYIGDPAAIALGKKFYFDPHFSGAQVDADMLLRPMTTPGRAALGQPIEVSCNTCHDVTRGGADQTADPPGNVVSFGGGAYDLNGQQTVNAAFSDLVYWNGRNDSLWSQIVAVAESHVSVNGSRLRTAWRIADAYRAEYEAVFPEYPLPAPLDSVAAHKARLEPDGTCTLDNGACPPERCHDDLRSRARRGSRSRAGPGSSSRARRRSAIRRRADRHPPALRRRLGLHAARRSAARRPGSTSTSRRRSRRTSTR